MALTERRQLRAARAMLGWSQEKLAEQSGVSVPTIKRLEPGDEPLATTVETLRKLQMALEAEGIEFLNHGRPGVRSRGSQMTTEPIYVDASQSAVLEHGATSINCPTVQEAVIEYYRLPPERKAIAKITSRGTVYSASEIERLHYKK
jgi:transcriptional regulator with XRE-family HTH domain